ncbi:MAG: tRNA lysidine(34) synthetase TilS [Myxococcota bacterium]|nr:tRNA lysidine(34) synthetase TilS [Myxococcota bacterium]
MLVRSVREALGPLDCRGRRVLVAVSGGVDSVSLAQALRELSHEQELKLSIGHVNHGLRGAESEADERAVQALGGRLDLAVDVERVEPEALRSGRSSRDRPTLQEAARTARYAALRAMAARRGAERIATAHNADDQAETVLLRLLRGTGPDGLGGIPERSRDGTVVRPLLGVSRAAIEHFARDRGLSWREDASNASDAYARNRLRHHWLPGLAREFNPALLRAIANLAEAQRRDSEWIEARVEQEAAARFSEVGDWLAIDTKDWCALPAALSRRLVRAALARCGSGRFVTRVHLERMVAFLGAARPATAIELPGGLRLCRDAQGHRLGPLAASLGVCKHEAGRNGGPSGAC